jgi:hypothetical protein
LLFYVIFTLAKPRKNNKKRRETTLNFSKNGKRKRKRKREKQL